MKYILRKTHLKFLLPVIQKYSYLRCEQYTSITLLTLRIQTNPFTQTFSKAYTLRKCKNKS